MIDRLIELLLALGVAAGAQGVGVAGDHAAPAPNDAALQALGAGLAVTVQVAQAAVDGLEVAASHVTNERALQALGDAATAREAGQAKAEAARSGNPPVAAPPVEVPAGAKPAAVPPVPAPPVEPGKP